MTTQKNLTVYFDGGCPLCLREIAFYRKRMDASTVDWVDVSSASDPAPDLSRANAMGRFHVRLSGGRLVSGARAFTALWRATPGFRTAGKLLGRRPAVDVLELGYRLFLRIRPALQRAAARWPSS